MSLCSSTHTRRSVSRTCDFSHFFFSFFFSASLLCVEPLDPLHFVRFVCVSSVPLRLCVVLVVFSFSRCVCGALRIALPLSSPQHESIYRLTSLSRVFPFFRTLSLLSPKQVRSRGTCRTTIGGRARTRSVISLASTQPTFVFFFVCLVALILRRVLFASVQLFLLSWRYLLTSRSTSEEQFD